MPNLTQCLSYVPTEESYKQMNDLMNSIKYIVNKPPTSEERLKTAETDVSEKQTQKLETKCFTNEIFKLTIDNINLESTQKILEDTLIKDIDMLKAGIDERENIELIASMKINDFKIGLSVPDAMFIVDVEIGRASCRERVSSPV